MKTYRKIRQEQAASKAEMYGVFFAFNQEQFREGVKACGYKKGDRIIRWVAGAYGTAQAIKAYCDALRAFDERIKTECTPEEVFEYEFWNHECGLHGDISMPLQTTQAFFPEWLPTEELYRKLMREFREING